MFPTNENTENQMIFACQISPGKEEREAIILAASIRKFAGKFANSHIWVFVPNNDSDIAQETKEKFKELYVRIYTYKLDKKIQKFPYAAKIFAAANAEIMAENKADYLVWLDSDSIMINEPDDMILPSRTYFGCRPVDHTLIGSHYDDPADDFWKLIYDYCNVTERKIFPMTSTVDEMRIRPYFNAGFAVVRPKNGLLQRWRDNFKNIYQKRCFRKIYKKQPVYETFMHQAVLTGTVLAMLEQKEIKELSELITYPLHMHSDYPVNRKVKFMNDLISCRYDMLFNNSEWQNSIPVKEPLKSWLDGQLHNIAN
jgi:hypothetical protein